MSSLACLAILAAAQSDARLLRVPEEHPTVQAALSAARSGDTVSVAPGVYRESLKLEKKDLLLIGRGGGETVIDGGGASGRDGDVVLDVAADVGPATVIRGLTFRNGGHGILCKGRPTITGNRFERNRDALSYEGGGGLCKGNVFEKNRDEAVDIDGSSDPVIEDNELRDCGDDGIEIRLHKHRGRPLEIVIRGNLIIGSREDGIQLIDYPDLSPRTIRIERNVIAKSAMAGLGCMADGNTKEDYSGAGLPERVFVIHNSFIDNEVGVSGGHSMVLLNNVFSAQRRSALRRVGGDSTASANLFWKNGADFDECDLDREGVVSADPALDGTFRPGAGSGAIDAGVVSFEFRGETLHRAASGTFSGKAPDLGAFESAVP